MMLFSVYIMCSVRCMLIQLRVHHISRNLALTLKMVPNSNVNKSLEQIRTVWIRSAWCDNLKVVLFISWGWISLCLRYNVDPYNLQVTIDELVSSHDDDMRYCSRGASWPVLLSFIRDSSVSYCIILVLSFLSGLLHSHLFCISMQYL